MRRQTLIALAIAVVLGLFAVYLANIYLTASEQRASASSEGLTKVAVAAVPLDFGVEVTPERVKFVDYPAASLPPGSFRSLSELLPGGQRRVALRPMLVNEPILAAKVSGEGRGASLAAVLPDGKRAMSVRINDVSGVAGFVQPHDAVDVLITRESGDRAGTQVTDILLQNIKVLAIGQDAKGDDGKPQVARTATLEVDPIEAQKLALAQQVGTLSLVLRKPGEEQNDPMAQTVSIRDLRYSLYSGARYNPTPGAAPAARTTVAATPRRTVRRPAPATTSNPPRPSTRNVEVVRGTEGSNYEVGRYGS